MNTARYDRQIILSEIGLEGQEKLRQARVLVVGVGGLGSPLSLYLAGMGIGTIGLIDDDVVSISNLQRQVLYTENEVGQKKVTCAKRRLHALNSEVNILEYPYRLTHENAFSIIKEFDIIVDGCDNYATRYLIDDICEQTGKVYVYGAIGAFGGQVAIFNHPDGHTRYRTLFPDALQSTKESSSEEKRGVIGVTPGVIGLLEANEVVKIVCQIGQPLIDKLCVIDLLSLQTNIISL